jgi:Arc/MetJ-type ribon-helix-helix transcriptional regulator
VSQLSIEIPEKMAAEIHRYLAQGWFVSEEELLRAALRDFLRRNPIESMKRFQGRDIDWAFQQQ